MTQSTILRNEAGGLRALWRVVVFCVATLAAFEICAFALGPVFAGLFSFPGVESLAPESWVELCAVLLATWFCLRVIDRRPWSDVWMGRDAAKPSWIGMGFLIGVFAIGVPMAMLVLAHWLRETRGLPGSLLGAAARVSAFLLPAAFVEELTVRGYLLSVLREAWGWPAAIAVTSIGFGVLHVFNEGASARPIVLVMLAGVFLASVVYATGSLYAAWMAHFAWNWTMAVLFHVAVSGFQLETPLYRYVDAGPDWATGGRWGPEGGIPAGLGMLAGMVFMLALRLASRRLQESREM